MLKILVLTCALLTVCLSQPLPQRYSDNDQRENLQNLNGREQEVDVQKGTGYTDEIAKEVQGFVDIIQNKVNKLTLGMSVTLYKVEDGLNKDDEKNRETIVNVNAWFSPSKMLKKYEKQLVDEANEIIEDDIRKEQAREEEEDEKDNETYRNPKITTPNKVQLESRSQNAGEDSPKYTYEPEETIPVRRSSSDQRNAHNFQPEHRRPQTAPFEDTYEPEVPVPVQRSSFDQRNPHNFHPEHIRLQTAPSEAPSQVQPTNTYAHSKANQRPVVNSPTDSNHNETVTLDKQKLTDIFRLIFDDDFLKNLTNQRK